uniref:Dipeptidyl peptidase 8 n=1 Tax=Triticum urartu TaxID=4572 RepID=A0A8R7UG75_TRIUA
MRSLDVAGAERSDQQNRKKPRRETEMPLAGSIVAGSSGDCGGIEESGGCLSMRVEDIVQHPLPGYGAPVALSFSPDDRRVAFLYSPDGTLHRKVFTFDPAKGRQELLFAPPDGGGLEESNLSAEERLRRERSRERGLGVTRYEWRARRSGGPSSRAGIVVPLPSGVYFQDLSGSEPVLKLQSSSTSPIIDPHLSPDGTMIAYVRDDELQCKTYNFGFDDGETKQLTYGARESGKVHGLAEYIAQEEMERKMGFWWSPDSKHLACTEVDSSSIPLYRIMHQGKSSVGLDAQEDHAYPFAGAANVKVRLGVVSSGGGEVTWMDLLCGEPNGAHGDEEYLARVNWMHHNALAVQVLNRAHTKLKLLKFDIATGKREVLLEEEHDIWITLHDCFTPLDNGVSSKHPGGFIWASEKTGFRHLYLHDKNGECLGPITQGDWLVDQIAGVNESSGLIYFTGTLDGPLETNLYCTNLFPDWSLPLQAPNRLTRGTGRHSVILDHQLLRFIDVYDSVKSPPVILLCSLLDGSVIMPLYEQPLTVQPLKKFQLKYNIGRVDAEDQLAGTEWLIKQGLAKPGHIGLYGWSYGGFLSAMCLSRFSDTFCCAVSGAPVTAWDGYDTFYTEKYLGLPSEHSDAYEYGSIMHHVKNLRGKLLLIHGMIDENVHFRHMPRQLDDRIYMEERIWDFVERSL